MSLLIRRHPLVAASLLAPALVVTGAFMIYPLINGVIISFTNRSLLRPTWRFVWFRNYEYLFEDPDFLIVVWNSFLFVFAAIAVSMTIGFALALLLNQGLRGTAFFRTAIFQIWIVPWISIAILWGWLFNADYGIVNFLLMDLGILSGPRNWLADKVGAQLVVISGFAWRMIPFMMVVSLAALQTIPREIIEAAEIDGAGYFARLRFVVMPLLRNMLMIVALLQAVKLFQEITLPWVLTQGGPVNATTTLSLYTYKLAFQQWDFGLASAAGAVWLAALLLFAIAYVRFSLRRSIA